MATWAEQPDIILISPYMICHGVSDFSSIRKTLAIFPRALECLLMDAGFARRMGAAGRESARARYHPDKVAERTKWVYRCAMDAWAFH